MLASNHAAILASLADGDVVLDVGGGGRPFARSDWVLDLMRYEDRGLYGAPDPGAEQFGPRTWVVRDICDREPFPFDDDEIDFAICSHTLEDIRDPIWVCSELSRIARAGYVEVPSRLEEQARGVHGPWVGWSHHRWLTDLEHGGLRFVAKPAVLQSRPDFSFPRGFARALAPAERVETLFWEKSLSAKETIFLDAPSMHAYLRQPVDARRERIQGSRSARLARRLRSRLSALR